MRVEVQHRRAAPRRPLVIVITLSLVLATAMTLGYHGLQTFAAADIAAKGGEVNPAENAFEAVGRIVGEAWPRQRAARAAAPPLPRLTFDLKRRAIGQLAEKRAAALRLGYLVQEDDDYVDADIRLTDGDRRNQVAAKIRLKGDFTDHLRGEKWSFRVRITGGDQILGMRVFSLQHPKVRGYAHESLILEHMRREGVLAPRYRFVRVMVNGRDKGIMALEEHFSKELLESQRRRASVIVRFDEALKWRTTVLMGQQIDFSAPYPLITPFQSGAVEADPNLRRDFHRAVALVRGFLSRDLAPSQVFDPEITARFLAVAEIWGAEHALAWNNMRFYFHPITGLLEPIAFDCNLQDGAFQFFPTALVSVSRMADHITADWLEDPRIRDPFLRHLTRLSQTYAAEAAWQPIRERELELQQILHQEFPLIPDVALGFFRLRAMRLATVDADNYRYLPLEFPNYPVNLHAFLETHSGGLRLQLYNLVPYPLRIEGLHLDPGVTTATKVPLTLPPTYGKHAPKPLSIDLLGAKAEGPVTVSVTSVIPGYPNSRSTLTAKPYSPTATRPVLPETTWEEVLKIHGGYLRRSGEAATLGPGQVRIDHPLLLPVGASLTIAAGTTIEFGPDALILARGPVQLPGTAAAPIRLRPAKLDWRGIAVLDAGAPSVWRHVELSNTRGLQLGDWSPTGSVMFYRSEVAMHDCRLTDNSAEDMLNLIQSKFTLENLTIERCHSDAFDADFCSGIVRGGAMRDIGGDGVDVSGTEIEVRDMQFERVRDKALSAGEASTMAASGIVARDCGTGVASKDASRVEIRESSFTDMRFVGLIAFQKKPEFGPGHIVAERIQMVGRGTPHRVQTDSTLRLDGQPILAAPLDVDALYKTGPMNKHESRVPTDR